MNNVYIAYSTSLAAFVSRKMSLTWIIISKNKSSNYRLALSKFATDKPLTLLK